MEGRRCNTFERYHKKVYGSPEKVFLPAETERAVIAKYPHMCIVEDRKGRRRGVAVGELIMNKVIKQNTYLEALRGERRTCNKKKSWHKKGTKQEAEYAP